MLVDLLHPRLVNVGMRVGGPVVGVLVLVVHVLVVMVYVGVNVALTVVLVGVSMRGLVGVLLGHLRSTG